MKYFLNIYKILSVLIVFTACSGKEQDKTKTETKVHDHSDVKEGDTSNTVTAPVLKNNHLNAVYQQYIQLTTALTSNNFVEAKIAANAIEAGAIEINGGNGIAIASARITAAADIEAQRAAYSTLSKNIEQLIRKEGLATGKLYVDYCPMALDDKGATWITSNKDIRNPYFGDKMLECGEIQDTIK